jgi:hypothetical protein
MPRLGKTVHPQPFFILGSVAGSLTVVTEMDTHKMTSVSTTV